jgi:hypothetical protein
VALAIDIGMVAIAKNQAQNAADSAACATVRTFNGQSGYNLAAAPVAGMTAAQANTILGSAIACSPASITDTSTDVYTSGPVTLSLGGYYYLYNDSNPSAEAFSLVVPGKAATQPYTAATATIKTTSPTFFGSIFGASPFNVIASATAAYRPRDIALIMDLSGSMRFESLPGVTHASTSIVTEAGARTLSLYPDPNYPTFGHYSATASAALQGTSTYLTTDVMITPNNLTYSAVGASPSIINDYMTSGSTPAFSAAPTSYATTPGGDNYLQSGGTYIQTVSGLSSLGATPTPTSQLNWCRTGYQGQTGSAFNKYTQGPSYWGKTFFIWPPDPQGSDLDPTNTANHADNGANDWRQRFFFKVNASTGALGWLDQNPVLFNPAGTANSNSAPIINCFGSTGKITTVTENGQSVNYYCLPNYAAIFNWLKNQTPTGIFPASMLSGRIQFYSKIPDPTGDTAFNSRFWTQNPMTDLSERFWKDYVDYMLGQVQTGAGTYANTGGILGKAPFTSMIGTGDLYAWGTVAITQKQDCNYLASVNNVGGYTAGTPASTAINLNNVTDLSGNTAKLPGPSMITNATNATPIVITCAGHGLARGNRITMSGVGGNTAANGTFLVGKTTATTFEIKTLASAKTVGNGNYTSGGAWVPAITAATNASPIVITTGANHGMTVGQPYIVNISGVSGNTAANGKWAVNVLSTTSFSLTNSTGNGAFDAAGSAATQWCEPYYYIRFGTTSTFYELKDMNTATGIMTGLNDLALTTTVANGSAVKIYTTIPAYMSYSDNSYRPKHQFWFGPQTWLDWLGNYSTYCYSAYGAGGTYTLRWAGNTHESQAWSCKVGLSAAISDIQSNHPADYVGLTFFNNPYDPNSKVYPGFYNGAMVPLGQNFTQLQNSLWFPPSTVTGTATSVTPYDPDFLNVPRAQGGTAPGMGFMIAYNMLSSSVANLRNYTQPSTTYRGFAGGLGRKGAQRLVIFETDGAPNWQAVATLNGGGTDSYYPIRLNNPTQFSASGNVEFPTTTGA